MSEAAARSVERNYGELAGRYQAEIAALRAANARQAEEIAELVALAKKLRRSVTGDIEWTATQFRRFINEGHDLCNAVDRLAALSAPKDPTPEEGNP